MANPFAAFDEDAQPAAAANPFAAFDGAESEPAVAPSKPGNVAAKPANVFLSREGFVDPVFDPLGDMVEAGSAGAFPGRDVVIPYRPEVTDLASARGAEAAAIRERERQGAAELAAGGGIAREITSADLGRTIGEVGDDALSGVRRGAKRGLASLAEMPVNALNTASLAARGLLGGDLLWPEWAGVQQPEIVQEFAGQARADANAEQRSMLDALQAEEQAAITQTGKGFLPMLGEQLGYTIQNPGSLVSLGGEQVGQMAAGGLVPGAGVTVQLVAQGMQAAGMSANETRERLVKAGAAPADVDRAVAETFGLSFAVNALLPELVRGGSAVEKLAAGKLSRGVGGAAAKVAVPTLGEAGTEGLAEGFDAGLVNFQTGRPVMEGVGAASGQGAGIGGAMGGGAGGIDATLSAIQDSKERAGAKDMADLLAAVGLIADPKDLSKQMRRSPAPAPAAPAPPAPTPQTIDDLLADPELAAALDALAGPPTPAKAGQAPAGDGGSPKPAGAALPDGSIEKPLPYERHRDAPVGAWIEDQIPGLGQVLFQIKNIPLEKMVGLELDPDGRVQPNKQRDVDEYERRMRSGEQAPNLRGYELDDGSIKIADGNRRLQAARAAGLKSLPVAVRPIPTDEQRAATTAQLLAKFDQNDAEAEAPAPAVPQSAPDAPGSELANGFRQGSEAGARYRVTPRVNVAGGAIMLEKRNDRVNSSSGFFVAKDGTLADMDTINHADERTKDRVWSPENEGERSAAVSILEQMGPLDLTDPRRQELKNQLKALVTGGVKPPQPAPERLGDTVGGKVKVDLDADTGLAELRDAEGGLIGNAIIENTPDGLQMRGMELEAGSRGKGLGIDAYMQLADRALAEGKPLLSDTEMTPDAMRMYPALERRGYTVERTSINDIPGFKVTAGPKQAAPVADVAPAAEPQKFAKMYTRGRNTRALSLPDGTWRVQVRKNGQWQPWMQREAFDPSPAFGYREFTPPGGYVNVDGKQVRLAPKEAPRPKAEKGPKRPTTALEALAIKGLNRDAWQREGVDPRQFGKRFGITPLFRKEGGRTPDEVLEFLQENFYLPRESEDKPAGLDNSDAIDVVMRGLSDEDTFADDDSEAVAAWRDFNRRAEEEWQQDTEATLADALPELDDADMDEAVRYAARLAEQEANRNEARDGAESEADERDRQVGEVRRNQAPAQADAPVRTPPERPAAPVAPTPEGATGTKNAVMERERAERGEDPILKALAQSNADTLAAARATLAENPDAGQEIVERLKAEGPSVISVADEAILLVEKVRIRNERDAAAAVVADETASDEAKQAARIRWNEAEARLNDMDQATVASGREWGRLGQFRQRMLLQDYSFAALERRERVWRDRPLTEQESSELKEYARRIERLEANLQATQQALDEANGRNAADAAYTALLDEMKRSMSPFRPSKTKLKENAEASLAALRELEGALESNTSNVRQTDRTAPLRQSGGANSGPTDLDLEAQDDAAIEAARRSVRSIEAALSPQAKAIKAAMGPAGRHIEVVESAADLPKSVLDRWNVNPTTEGIFDPASGRVFVFISVGATADTRMTPARAVWVAMHETAGHLGMRGAIKKLAGGDRNRYGERMVEQMARAQSNDFVKSLARAIRRQRPDASMNLAAEEALAEIAAAVQTGNWNEITTRYGLDVPRSMRGGLRAMVDRLLQEIRRFLQNIMVKEAKFTDGQVLALLRDAWRYAQTAPVGEAGTDGAGSALEQRAFHGTPHTVKKFSLLKIGSGEGAQAYGWGLYFASKRKIAEHYRDNVKDMAQVDSANARLSELSKIMDADSPNGYRQFRSDAGRNAAAEYDALIEQKTRRGNLYEVEVPEDSDLLDFEAPLAKQPEKVQAAIRAIMDSDAVDAETRAMLQQQLDGAAGLTGQQFYKTLATSDNLELAPGQRPEQAVSELLAANGVPGLRYLDGDTKMGGKVDSGDARLIRELEASGGDIEAAATAAMRGVYNTATEKVKIRRTYVKRLADLQNRHNYVIWDESAIGEPVPLESRRANDEYAGQHLAPMSDSGAPGHDITGGGTVYPDDAYGPSAARYYGTGNDAMDAEAFAIVAGLKGRPNKDVVVYRAVPKIKSNADLIAEAEDRKRQILRRGSSDPKEYDRLSDEIARLSALPESPVAKKIGINRGDWLAITRAYAKDHGESVHGRGGYTILSKTVKASDIFTNGDSIQEWGYDPAAGREDAPLESRRAGSGDLFGAPTQRDEIDAERRRRDAERDGRTGTGRTDMAAGRGDLFSGARPEQADLDRPLESRRAPFYSAALRAVEEGKGAPKKADAAGWKGWIDGAVRRGEMKQSERDWIGLDAWIDGRGQTTRQELADFIRANQVQVEDVVLGGDQTLDNEVSAELGEWLEDAGYDPEDLTTDEDWRDVASVLAKKADEDEDGPYLDLYGEAMRHSANMRAGMTALPPKFAQWQIPGGKDYRELLLTLPTGEGGPVSLAWEQSTDDMLTAELPNGRLAIIVYDSADSEAGATLDTTDQDGDNGVGEIQYPSVEEAKSAAAALVVERKENTGRFRSSHFDQPDILAHVRFNSRTDADGERVLFIEEIQSDWHQAGRKRGYAGDGVKVWTVRDANGDGVGSGEGRNAAEALAAWRRVAANPERGVTATNTGQAWEEGGGVPDAPLKATDDWAILAFKRMVRWAVDNGFGRIAWTTGKQQNERYDLAKQVDWIEVKPTNYGSKDVGIRPKGGGQHIRVLVDKDGGVKSGNNAALNLDGKMLDEVVGKDMAEKIMAQDGAHRFEGLELAIGGDGMRGFYDKILPSAVNKWAKKFGGKVGQVVIPSQEKVGDNQYVQPRVTGGYRARFGSQAESFGTEQEAKAWLASKQQLSQHSLDITEGMRQAAEEGMPLFSVRADQGSAVDPTQFFHLARIGAVPVSEGVKDFDGWSARMKADLGAKLYASVETAMPQVFEASKLLTEGRGGEARPIDPKNITTRDVYNLARKHVQDGAQGEDAVMKAVTKDVQALDPEMTERDVRVLFTEYGKVNFPSKDADKVLLREIRALVQIQLSIDRLLADQDALKSGPQRDKATQKIREKRRTLNDLLKLKMKNKAASPEVMATYQQARITNLQNQIDDLTKQIATGERPVRAKAPAPSPELAALIAQRDALQKERDAIDNPRSTRENEAKKRALRKQIEDVQARLAGKKKPTPERPFGPDDADVSALKAELAAARDALKALERPTLSPDERFQRGQAASLERQMAQVKARIAANDYARRPRPEPKELSAANQKAKIALLKVKAEFARRQFEDEMAQRHPVRKVFANTGELLMLTRAYLTSLDWSALMRQGGVISYGNPVRAAKGVPSSVRAAFSEEQALAAAEEIANRPNARLYEKYGLELTKSDTFTLSEMEEKFASRWLEKMPRTLGGGLVRASGRGYVATLNRLRADSFDAMVAALSLSKVPTDAEGKAIANYINVSTGRGLIGPKNKWGGAGLNIVFFAPRLVASRFNLLGFQPIWGGSNRTRVLILKEYARFLMGVSVVFALAAAYMDAFGDDDDEPLVTMDPRSSNFLKIKFGNTYLDPMTGLSQVTVFASRIASGETVTSDGELRPLRDAYRLTDYFGDTPLPEVDYGGNDIMGVTAQFARTKLAPIPGQIATIAIGENYDGEVPTLGSVVYSSVVPISFQDVHGIMTDNGLPTGAGIMLLSLLGIGVQHRKPDPDRIYSAAARKVDALTAEMEGRISRLPKEQWQGEFDKLQARYPTLLGGSELAVYKDNAQNRNLGRAGVPMVDKKGQMRIQRVESDTTTPKDFINMEAQIRQIGTIIKDLKTDPNLTLLDLQNLAADKRMALASVGMMDLDSEPDLSKPATIEQRDAAIAELEQMRTDFKAGAVELLEQSGAGK